jgi:SET domain
MSPNNSNEDCYGVFAKQFVSKDSHIMTDNLVIAGKEKDESDFKMRRCGHCFAPLPPGHKFTPATCCGMRFCCSSCMKTAIRLYHKPCHRNFDWLYHLNSDPKAPYSSEGQVLLRLLSVAARSPEEHPLRNPYIARFTAGYRANPPFLPLSFTALIINPIRMLESLGVDPFQDAKFDTWVIQCLFDRIVDNFGASAEGESLPFFLGGLYSMFNHSCTPNLTMKRNSSAVVELYAARDIDAGEEYFVSYIGLGMNKAERQTALRAWFNECLCEKCQCEMKV